MARLHLIHDILHNSAASISNAWKFRLEFQSRLGLIFDHLSTIYHSFPGRITADSFKVQITAIVDVWENALVFPPEYTQNLRLRLEGLTTEPEKEESVDVEPELQVEDKLHASKFKSSGFKPATALDNSIVVQEEKDEEQTDVDGMPMDDGDGVPMDNIDGVPMDDVYDVTLDDVDGIPMDDVDGDPM